MTSAGPEPAWELASRDDGSGTPLVLLHAFPVDGRLYDGLRGRVAARLITADFPGFGRTRLREPAPDVLTTAALAEGLIAWLEGRNLGPVVLGGTAIGGYVALEVGDARPDLVRGLVLMGCKPAPDAPERAADREELARVAVSMGSGTVADRLATLPLAATASSEVRAQARAMIAEADPRAIAALIRGIATRPDPTPALLRLRVPLLVVAGEEDSFSPFDEQRRLAGLVPGSMLAGIPNAGHFPSLERPVEVAAALDAFLATVG